MYFSCAYPHLATLCLLAVKFSVILILHMLTKLCCWYPGDRRNLLQLLTKMQGFSRPCCRTNIMHAWKNKQHYSNKAELITDILMLTFLLKSVWFLEGFINFQIRSLPPFPSHQPNTRLNEEWSQTHAFYWDIYWGPGCRFKVFKDIYLFICGVTCHILALYGAITEYLENCSTEGKQGDCAGKRRKGWSGKGCRMDYEDPFLHRSFSKFPSWRKGRKT